MNSVAPVVYVLTVAAGFMYFVGCAWAAHHLAKTTKGINDDAKAKELFLKLVKAAKKQLVIYDDGDAKEGSIYEDEGVIKALEQRLDSFHDLKVQCLFNKPGDTLFVRTFQKHDQVDIGTAAERSDTHFRIADSGTIGWISQHREDADHRPYEMHDFQNVPALFGAAFMRKSTFGAHIRKVEQHFA